MEELQKKVKQILSDLESNLKDKEDIEYAKNKVFELYSSFADEIEKIEETCVKKVDSMAARYSVLETRMAEIESVLNKIEKDIYIGEEEYDLDIVCPYCEAEFTIDSSDEKKESIICPECNHEIELDWNEEHECGHDCHHCDHDCSEEENEDDM